MNLSFILNQSFSSCDQFLESVHIRVLKTRIRRKTNSSSINLRFHDADIVHCTVLVYLSGIERLLSSVAFPYGAICQRALQCTVTTLFSRFVRRKKLDKSKRYTRNIIFTFSEALISHLERSTFVLRIHHHRETPCCLNILYLKGLGPKTLKDC
jgi:hypothetical protein